VNKTARRDNPAEDGRLFRTVSLDAGAINRDARTVEVCFSSEAPVTRWYGEEILSHDAAAVDLSRLQDGATVLFNHDFDAYIGVVQSARIDGDRKGRATLKFNAKGRGAEIWDDILAGALRFASVGYQIGETQYTDATGGVEKRTALRWTPFEISIVTVPADTNAAIGRDGTDIHFSTTKTNRQMTTDNATNTTTAAPAPQAPAPEAGGEQRSQPPAAPAPAAPAQRITAAPQDARTIGILDLARVPSYRASIANISDLADAAIRNGDSVEAFTRTLLDQFNERGAQTRSEGATIGLTDTEARNFSFTRLLGAMTAGAHERGAQEAAAFELDVCRAAADKASKQGRNVRGFFVPDDVLKAGRRDIFSAKTGTGYTGTGANIVPNTYHPEAFLDLLRNKCVLERLAFTLGGLVGTITLPKKASGTSAGWIGEDDQAPATSLTVAKDALSHRTLAAYTGITRDMLNQTSPDIENIIRSDLATAVAQAVDYAGFYGTGASGQPTGLKNVSGVNAVDFGGTALTWAKIVEMETVIASDNADLGSKAFVFNNSVLGKSKTTLKQAGVSGYINEGGTINGYPYDVTEQVAAADIFFGVWKEFTIATWGGIELLADRVLRTGGTELAIFRDINFMVRRPECFALATLAAPAPAP
jgi:HK97 family phage major capsid protein/HK97 family phage prohead protease